MKFSRYKDYFNVSFSGEDGGVGTTPPEVSEEQGAQSVGFSRYENYFDVDFKNEERNPKIPVLEQAINDHVADVNNPHNVTTAQLGLDKVENKTVSEIQKELTADAIIDDDYDDERFVTGNQLFKKIITILQEVEKKYTTKKTTSEVVKQFKDDIIEAGTKANAYVNSEIEGLEISIEKISGTENIVIRNKSGRNVANVDATAFLQDSFLQDVYYDINTHKVTFVWKLGDGTIKTSQMDISDLSNVYTVEKGADQVQLAIKDNVISAYLIDNGITRQKLSSQLRKNLDNGEAALTQVTSLQNEVDKKADKEYVDKAIANIDIDTTNIKQEVIDASKEYIDEQISGSSFTFYDAETIKNNIVNQSWDSINTYVEDGYACAHEQDYYDVLAGIKVEDGVVDLRYVVSMGGLNAGVNISFLIGELNATAGAEYVFPRTQMSSSEGETVKVYVAELTGGNALASGTYVQTGTIANPEMSGVYYSTGYYDGFTFTAPSTKKYGIWVDVHTNAYYWAVVSSGTVADLSSFIYPIDKYATKKYVQEELAKVPSGGVTSWNDLTDKPFYDETITFDGNIEGKIVMVHPQEGEAIEQYGEGVWRYVKISDETFTAEQLTSAKMSQYMLYNGEATEHTDLSTEFFAEEIDGRTMIGDDNFLILFFSEAGDYAIRSDVIFTAPEKGLYLSYYNFSNYHGSPVLSYITSITFPDSIKTLEEKFLPETVVLENELADKVYTKTEVEELLCWGKF